MHIRWPEKENVSSNAERSLLIPLEPRHWAHGARRMPDRHLSVRFVLNSQRTLLILHTVLPPSWPFPAYSIINTFGAQIHLWQRSCWGGEGRTEVEIKTRRQQRGVLNHSLSGAAAGGIGRRSRVILTVTQLPGQFVLVRDHRGVQVSHTNVWIISASTISILKCFCTTVWRFYPTAVSPWKKTVILAALLSL